MKKILFFATVVVIGLSSCSKDEVIIDQSPDNLIGFDTCTGVTNRATEMVDANFKTFNVSAYYLADAWSSGTVGTPYINNEVIDRTGTSAKWVITSGKHYYWPMGTTDNLNFFATSPAQNLSGAASGMPSFTYNVNPSVTDQEDLLVALAMNKTKANTNGSNGAVNFTFSHALTKIQFSAACAVTGGMICKVKKIEVIDVFPTNTYTFASSGGAWATAEGTKTNYTYYENSTGSDISTVTPSKTNVDGTNGALMMVPQTIGTINIQVTYDVYQNDIKIADFTTTPKKVAITDNWEKGKSIRYNLVLPATGGTGGASEITFTTDELGAWDSEGAADVTVPAN
ncbi:fimbrillin family protein [Bacteroides sp.]|uniref:fimbrillin family protein n=1 Tax=Bacteroides sp. TaxID=29523 RepID=UPI002619D60A|nr:fimbrillin family protein [Bacteroides sp.]MDD3038675.1 fimbrillin family protein [Bacteroides sp.]